MGSALSGLPLEVSDRLDSHEDIEGRRAAAEGPGVPPPALVGLALTTAKTLHAAHCWSTTRTSRRKASRPSWRARNPGSYGLNLTVDLVPTLAPDLVAFVRKAWPVTPASR